VTDHEPFAQSVYDSVQVQATIERTEGGSFRMGAPAALPNRMTRRAHSFGESPAVPLQTTRLVLLGESERWSEQQQQDCES
jgi:hypothetical protein